MDSEHKMTVQSHAFIDIEGHLTFGWWPEQVKEYQELQDLPTTNLYWYQAPDNRDGWLVSSEKLDTDIGYVYKGKVALDEAVNQKNAERRNATK